MLSPTGLLITRTDSLIDTYTSMMIVMIYFDDFRQRTPTVVFEEKVKRRARGIRIAQ